MNFFHIRADAQKEQGFKKKRGYTIQFFPFLLLLTKREELAIMNKIQKLDDQLINQIAAGEVVERPSSVVKELVENSIDSGADQIFVTIQNGGKDYISVLDNGSGMTSDDARACIERHATSKITSMEDLFKTKTLGFRGEALAAISAVSRFELTTCQNEEVGGFLLKLEGGKEIQSNKVGFPQGTRITIEDLFFNVPARQKFLKAIQTEYQHIYDLILKLALAKPEIQFRLTHNKKVVINLGKGESFSGRIRNCYGAEIASDLYEIEHQESYLKFSGLFSKPDGGTRKTKRWQQVFINGRSVKNQTISHAIVQGYSTLLMKNQYPMFFINIEIDPAEVDVNVHPAKAEARMKNTALVSTILSSALQRGLKAASREEFIAPQSPDEPKKNELFNGKVKEHPHHQNSLPQAGTAPKIFIETSEQLGFETEVPRPVVKSPEPSPTEAPEPSNQTLESPAAQQPPEEPFLFAPAKGLEAVKKVESDPFSLIGQLANKYILASGDDCLVLIDQHAAHERVRFEEVRQEFYGKGISCEKLLIPQMIELAPQEGLLLEQHLDHWERFGFLIEPFGGRDYKLSGVPAILKNVDASEVIKDVLDEMSSFGRSGKLEIFFNEVFEKVACHSAIRAGQPLSKEEMQGLLTQLVGLDLQIHCPHGRPVLNKISLNELDKRFKRIV